MQERFNLMSESEEIFFYFFYFNSNSGFNCVPEVNNRKFTPDGCSAAKQQHIFSFLKCIFALRVQDLHAVQQVAASGRGVSRLGRLLPGRRGEPFPDGSGDPASI